MTITTVDINTKQSGTLHILATPIGNLGDISKRAIQTLKSVDLILAEDTRCFRKLATTFSIQTPVRSYHEHNERKKAQDFAMNLKNGMNIALVSDAGTPLISDPGYHLIQACYEHDIPITSIPGPCSAIAALAISGFDTTRFSFEGFLPHKPGKRLSLLKQILGRETTTICFESPHRIVKALCDVESLDPKKQIFIARELTKLHEEILRGPAAELGEILSARTKIKGEIVMVISGK